MKKFFYTLAAAALCAACTTGQTGYVIKGTIADAQDGEQVYLQRLEGRSLVAIDSTTLTAGQFTFSGTGDSVYNAYITYQRPGEPRPQAVDLFLENGEITVSLGEETTSATGTPTNDAYQAYRDQTLPLTQQMRELYKDAANPDLSPEEKEAASAKVDELDEQISAISQETLKANIANALGSHLLKQTYYYMETAELDELLPQIPEPFASDPRIVHIKELVVKLKATAVGQKFTDFEMLTPDGKPIKLSDYAGQGKYVLIDFWASWCGPCRREMPNIVQAYKTYKRKGLEIVGVSLDRDGEAWQKAIKDDGITWPQMSDLKFWSSLGADIYGVNSIPHTILLDPEGIIIARGLHGDGLQEKLAEIFQ